ncbi:MAG TPA: DUF3311 domain-containing protein [Solirubrobacteraceae bacterium]|nr:DUF3311 domain-containing protein [Solirubrobacteraceae bacterium]
MAQGEDRASNGRGAPAAGGRGRGSMWLLLLPFAALLVPPLYAHETPHLWGIPFFYWYQGVWLIVTAGITTFVYRRMR